MSLAYRLLISIYGVTAVVLGAMGSHGSLHRRLIETESLERWRQAQFYHLTHTLALLVILLMGDKIMHRQWTMRLWALGVFIFCGSVYLYSLTLNPVYSKLAPVGGTCFILGWGSILFLKK
jgi:uncharacterized membrane protein YgdD (TMEM256/DUF423 family)